MARLEPAPETDLDRRGPTRLSEYLDQSHWDELQLRRRLTEAEADGTIKRFVVGNEVFVKAVSPPQNQHVAETDRLVPIDPEPEHQAPQK